MRRDDFTTAGRAAPLFGQLEGLNNAWWPERFEMSQMIIISDLRSNGPDDMQSPFLPIT